MGRRRRKNKGGKVIVINRDDNGHSTKVGFVSPRTIPQPTTVYRKTYSKPIDEEKAISFQKMLVGHYIETIPEDASKSTNYVLQGNGIWEQRRNDIGTFNRKIASCKVLGLRSNLTEGWTLNVPKIPISLLGTAVSFFRKICAETNDEVFLQFFYNKETKQYEIECPEQEVSGASVKYKNSEVFNDPNKVLVFEIHSHNTMEAFFSATDNGDEKADRFYGVVGKLNQHFPSIKMRQVIGGESKDIDIDDLFDLDGETYHSQFPEEWRKKVSTRKYTTKKYYSSGSYPHCHGNKYGNYGGQGNGDMKGNQAWENHWYNYQNNQPKDNSYVKKFFEESVPKDDDTKDVSSKINENLTANSAGSVHDDDDEYDMYEAFWREYHESVD